MNALILLSSLEIHSSFLVFLNPESSNLGNLVISQPLFVIYIHIILCVVWETYRQRRFDLLDLVNSSRRQLSDIRERFDSPKSRMEIFYHLSFCLLVPQARHSSALDVVERLKQLNFHRTHRDDLEEILKPVRFKKQKAIYLNLMKESFPLVLDVLNQDHKGRMTRRILIKMIKGLGPKASSHFLRNMGHMDLAILDTHSLRFLGVESPRTLVQYECIEDEYALKASSYGLTVGEFDMLIWKLGSGIRWEDFVF